MIVLLGFALAVGAGVLAVYLRNLGVSEADQLAMSGMYAFGDAVTFLFVAGLCALPPLVLLLRTLELGPRFWRAYATVSIVVATTGLIAALAVVTESFESTIRMLAPLRLIVSLLCVPIWAIALFPNPSRRRALAGRSQYCC